MMNMILVMMVMRMLLVLSAAGRRLEDVARRLGTGCAGVVRRLLPAAFVSLVGAAVAS